MLITGGSMDPIFKLSNFIDGKYVAPVGGKYLDNYEPATGTVYSHVPDSDEVRRNQ